VNFTPYGKYPYDIAANGLAALIFAYAILRYQLLDIRVVIRQGLVYSIPTIIIGTTYFLIITLFLSIFEAYSGLNIFIISLLVAIISALLAEPLRVRAQSWVDRMFFREKYDSSQMLQNLSGNVASVLDLYKITDMILDEVCSTLHISRAAFFLRDEDTNRFHLTSHLGQEDAQLIEFRPRHPIVLWLSSHNDPLSRNDMETLPQFQSLWKSERDDLERLGASLFIPIKVLESLVGIFLVGSKKSEQAYSMEERIILSTVANQTAVAIENARLYTSDQTRLKELNTLYSMARRLVTTDNLDHVVKTVSRHAADSINARYSRIILRENNEDYICKAVFPEDNDIVTCKIGEKEPLVAEHFYNWIMQQGETVVVHRDDYSLHDEERSALFFIGAHSVCLSPLKGADENIGLLVIGDDNGNKNFFTSSQVRLINIIADYSTSAIQRAMLHDRLEDSFLQTVISLANAMDARDSYTGDHSQRMAEIAAEVGKVLGLKPNEVENLRWAAILHDIGKIGVPDEILNKEGPLTKEEWVVMKEHPVIGAQIVEPVTYLSDVSPLIRAHHERYDGTGYPYGLVGEEIPLGARILSVVDAYIAIRDKRVYSESHTHEEAIAELRRFSGTQFDPEVVDVFCKTITG
jgi:putative nucleotidyltransferase with HDIG domain